MTRRSANFCWPRFTTTETSSRRLKAILQIVECETLTAYHSTGYYQEQISRYHSHRSGELFVRSRSSYNNSPNAVQFTPTVVFYHDELSRQFESFPAVLAVTCDELEVREEDLTPFDYTNGTVISVDSKAEVFATAWKPSSPYTKASVTSYQNIFHISRDPLGPSFSNLTETT